MKMIATRHHKTNPASYESLEFGRVLELDPEKDILPKGYKDTPHGWSDYMEDLLDEHLEISARRAVKSGGLKDSHIRKYYGIKEKA